MEARLEDDHSKLDNKVRFILEVNDGKLQVSKRKRSDVLAELKKRGYRAFPPKASDHTPAADENNEEEGEDASATSGGYNYLLNLSIWHLTYEKVCFTSHSFALFVSLQFY